MISCLYVKPLQIKTNIGLLLIVFFIMIKLMIKNVNKLIISMKKIPIKLYKLNY